LCARGQASQVFENGGVSQSSPAQPAGQASVISFGHLPVNQQSKAFLEAQFRDVRRGRLVG
jgi:hypothetical protein